ncbi:MAG: ribosomal protein [Bacteriovoracaceae bacterium]|nr:ribosomal protein [Bacteriovoracaceae bacterium]
MDDSRNEYTPRPRLTAAQLKKKKAKKKSNFKKKRPPLSLEFNYKDLSKLYPFLTDEGKIVGARISGLRAFQQRQLTLAVKRARQLAFVSPVNREFIH